VKTEYSAGRFGADERQRLEFLARIVLKEASYLRQTDGLLFATGPLSPQALAGLTPNSALAERMDAFVARFGRLQDTLGDKLLPVLLKVLDGHSGPLIDNLNRAARLGWIEEATPWLAVRRLRNQMVHEYVEDPAILADALNGAHEAVPMLMAAAHRWTQEWRSRSGEKLQDL
jgi:hypothetical protein